MAYHTRRLALSCIVCGCELEEVFEESDNQPNDGTNFFAYGQYGSTVFDPMDGSHLEVNVCDSCLKRASELGRVKVGRWHRQVFVELVEGGKMHIGRERVTRPLLPWIPEMIGDDQGEVVFSEEELDHDYVFDRIELQPGVLKFFNERRERNDG